MDQAMADVGFVVPNSAISSAESPSSNNTSSAGGRLIAERKLFNCDSGVLKYRLSPLHKRKVKNETIAPLNV